MKSKANTELDEIQLGLSALLCPAAHSNVVDSVDSR